MLHIIETLGKKVGGRVTELLNPIPELTVLGIDVEVLCLDGRGADEGRSGLPDEFLAMDNN